MAHNIAMNILTVVEKKKLADVTPKEYLTAIAEAINALDAIVH